MNRNKLSAKLHILLKQTAAEEFKDDLYQQYGVTTSRDLTDWQLSDLIQRLEGRSQSTNAVTTRDRSTGKTRSALQSQVLATLTRLGIKEDATKSNAAARWAELNQFVRSKNPAGKTIPEMSSDELQRLFVTLKSIESKGWRRKEAAPAKTPAPVVIPIPMSPADPVN
jgi:hypothetical protein